MNLRKLVATLTLGAATVGGAVAVSSPAQAACTLSAYRVTAGYLMATGERSGCAGSSVIMEVRFTKQVSLLPDPFLWNRATLQNGTVSRQGDCRFGGPSLYYTWVVINGDDDLESPRDTRC